ncbi:Type I secretion system, outer membrane component LapE [hydrothermal vent metagenome]|uniref:Type I secretion system, outer membrane component LapE n=1 Tax=hydrothermal vent metagenome TaxID=652676 RepID=A0A1W1CK94_9ZZZZ
MMINRVILLVSLSLPLVAGVKNLTLHNALQMVKHDNLEVKIARFNEQMKQTEVKVAEGMNYGKLDVSLSGMRSNDAGNVFGFKLQSREATFGDFGAEEFMNNFGACQNGNMQACHDMYTQPPSNLNYPAARNNYQTKLSYMLPIYTGGKLTEYKHIMESMYRMSKYDTQKLINTKIYEVKKAFYDISLVERYIVNLSKIRHNIKKLENIVLNMEKEGYAKETDILEVQAREAESDSMYNQARLNRELAYQFLSFLLNRDVSSIKKVHAKAPMPRVTKAILESNNIDIQKAKLGLQISEMSVKAKEAGFLPTIGGFAEYGSADNTLFNDFTGKDSYTVGVQAKWNIFNGGQDEAKLEKAKLKRLQVRDQVALARKGIALKAKKLKTEILSADDDIKSYSKQLKYAKRVYANYRTRYEEGMASISDVLIQQSKELESLLKLLTVVNKRNTKVFELESIVNAGGKV